MNADQFQGGETVVSLPAAVTVKWNWCTLSLCDLL